MDFNVLAFLYTMGCCLVSIIIAGKSASKKNNKEWFENLNHPDNSFMLKYMNIIGIGFYLLFGYVLYQLFVNTDIVPIIIAVVIIQLMGLCPFLLYKTKKLKLFFFANLVFLILVPLLIFFLLQTNLILAILVIVYFVWFVYDLSYWYRLMKLNK
jgi:tryptophan-rich sensory protein